MVKKRLAVCLIAAVCAFACMFCVTACGSADENNLVGEWQVQDTDSIVVFTGSEYKQVGVTFDYTVDPGQKTITFKQGDLTGVKKYSFDSNNQKLTIEETDGAGGTRTVVFDKVSDNGNAEPSAGGVTEDEL